ncbi:hypothetical protein RND71_020994 [Anisodus tanguticus]|uniref:Ubiquitin-like protease family profile domain-containing protein n=1 Tax=Anisodus tanguticus TaxID=243964 RepID=A0AAE1VFQ6_9SOLA|nr:hypothetical protein RND71_020994 [Anisodus tanguticus]
MIETFPKQSNIDCGFFVACFAEYLIENIELCVVNFDIDGLRSRYGILLWHYRRQKQENGEYNDYEDSERWRKQILGKKRKKKT